jgi:hypothetical protein
MFITTLIHTYFDYNLKSVKAVALVAQQCISINQSKMASWPHFGPLPYHHNFQLLDPFFKSLLW